MGVAVANMPPLGMNDSKKLHPFFQPGKGDCDRQGQPSVHDSSPQTSSSNSANQNTSGEYNGILQDMMQDVRSGKRKRTETKNGRAQGDGIDGSFSGTTGGITDIIDPRLEETTMSSTAPWPSSGRSRNLPGQLSAQSQLEHNVQAAGTNNPVPSLEKEEQEQATKPEASSDRPKRILRFNPKTGTIGSPPKPKPTLKKATNQPAQATLIVKLKFGHDEASRQRIGQKILDILSTMPNPANKTPPKKRGRPSKTDKAKLKNTGGTQSTLSQGLDVMQGSAATSSAAKSSKASTASRPTVLSSTPCSPKKPRAVFKSANFPQFGSRSSALRVPGAAHPAWPAQGMAHVTGDEGLTWACHASEGVSNVVSKKSKGRPVNVSPAESVLQLLSETLDIDGAHQPTAQTIGEAEQHSSYLRLPGKHFESGTKLQQRVRPELRTALPLQGATSDSDDDIIMVSTRKLPHAAISRLYSSLPTNLSAFDRSECEDLSWSQKYAPITAEEVLQTGREAVMLRDWLEALKVQSVDTGVSADAKAVLTKSTTVAKKNKKRKRGKLDDFIVSSDEELNDLDDITDPEEEGQGQSGHTIVQNGGVIPKAGKETVRLSNVALISGPHGSGKTATVYAIAKELGFEVFEINSSARRSGKDIIEKVGDMTRNHLVHGHQEDGHRSESSKNTAGSEKDAKNSKQGSVMSFFKPKPTANVTPAAAPSLVTEPIAGQQDQEKSTSNRSQKQSLILLEEVDILYEEDKQFWATITTLIAQSKRPFIMTCNDESAVPLHLFNFYGMFRFSPPPTDLAIDLLLLIAANEGHALRRHAVQTLLESKRGDIRASITELSYWCQIGVGDRRGGFDWFYPRWPRGSDLDDTGNVVRVISEGTYLEGMGWLGRDAVTQTSLDVEEELMAQCWSGLDLDIGDWHQSRDMAGWAARVAGNSVLNKKGALEACTNFAEAMSAADLASSGQLGSRFQDALDATQPAIPVKARDDYVVGRKLLEAPFSVDYENVGLNIMFAMRSKARDAAQRLEYHQHDQDHMRRTEEEDAMSTIKSSFRPGMNEKVVTRMDMAFAFDPIALSEQRSLGPTTYLDPSIFDRTMRLITLDVAPFVRGIVAYDRQLAEGRVQRGTLLSEGARPGKRLRQTRAALSAGDGTGLRRESYFRGRINPYLVMKTGGDWEGAVTELVRSYPEPPVDAEVAHAVAAPPYPAAAVSHDTTYGGKYVQIQPRPM